MNIDAIRKEVNKIAYFDPEYPASFKSPELSLEQIKKNAARALEKNQDEVDSIRESRSPSSRKARLKMFAEDATFPIRKVIKGLKEITGLLIQGYKKEEEFRQQHLKRENINKVSDLADFAGNGVMWATDNALLTVGMAMDLGIVTPIGLIGGTIASLFATGVLAIAHGAISLSDTIKLEKSKYDVKNAEKILRLVEAAQKSEIQEA